MTHSNQFLVGISIAFSSAATECTSRPFRSQNIVIPRQQIKQRQFNPAISAKWMMCTTSHDFHAFYNFFYIPAILQFHISRPAPFFRSHSFLSRYVYALPVSLLKPRDRRQNVSLAFPLSYPSATVALYDIGQHPFFQNIGYSDLMVENTH